MSPDEQRDRLASFAKAIIRRDCWGDLSVPDGGDIQDMAVKHGLLIKTAYDPEKHGENDYGLDPGDPWFVFADWLCKP